jgi:hypothetical protein
VLNFDPQTELNEGSVDTQLSQVNTAIQDGIDAFVGQAYTNAVVPMLTNRSCGVGCW